MAKKRNAKKTKIKRNRAAKKNKPKRMPHSNYVLNVSRNYIVEKDVDPEKFGRKLAVLQDLEALAD